MTADPRAHAGSSRLTASRARRLLIPVLAICCGVTVANLYLSQPLLTLIRTDLGVSSAAAGMVPALAQFGYAVGLLLFVPLGDVVRRRTLLSALLIAAVAALVAAAAARGLLMLAMATFAACAVTVVPQLLIPLSAEFAPPERRGRTLAILQAGLLTGIVAAWVVGGQIADHAGWRTTYLVAAVCTALVGVATVALLPDGRPTARVGYGKLLASLPRLFRDEQILREACVLQAVSFGVFSLFWTTLVFLLTSGSFGWDVGTVAWLGVSSIAGVVAAPFVGRVVDRYSPLPVVGTGLAMVAAAALLFAMARLGIVVVAVAVAVLNIGLQCGQIANQSRIFTLDPATRSRLNTVYMLAVFLAGGAGAALGSILYDRVGWAGVAATGVTAALSGLALWVRIARRYRGQRLGPSEATEPDADRSVRIAGLAGSPTGSSRVG